MIVRLLFAAAIASFYVIAARPPAANASDAKVTLVYDHALPNVPGKSLKAVLVEY